MSKESPSKVICIDHFNAWGIEKGKTYQVIDTRYIRGSKRYQIEGREGKRWYKATRFKLA